MQSNGRLSLAAKTKDVHRAFLNALLTWSRSRVSYLSHMRCSMVKAVTVLLAAIDSVAHFALVANTSTFIFSNAFSMRTRKNPAAMANGIADARATRVSFQPKQKAMMIHPVTLKTDVATNAMFTPRSWCSWTGSLANKPASAPIERPSPSNQEMAFESIPWKYSRWYVEATFYIPLVLFESGVFALATHKGNPRCGKPEAEVADASSTGQHDEHETPEVRGGG